jgi:hypothetical protein
MTFLEIWHLYCQDLLLLIYLESNNHFVNITENMYLNPDTAITFTKKLDNYISGRIPENIFFTIPLVSSQYVLQQLATLDILKATGLYNISAKFLKNIISSYFHSFMPYFSYVQ